MSNENPKWLPVDAMRKFQDAGKRRAVRTDSGKTRKIPALPFEYWLKPSGSVVRLVVMTTRNVRDAVDPQRYADYTRRNALKRDWVPWDWAEVKTYAPHLAAGCNSEQDWHKRRAEIQAKRQAEHNAITEHSSKWLNAASEQKKLETTEAFTAALKEFGDAMKAQGKPKGNG